MSIHVARVMSLPEGKAGPLLDEVSAEFSQRHQQIRNLFLERFEQVRELRTSINTGVQYKANGRTFAGGFTLFNTPEALAARNTNLAGTALYNQYRAGAGHYNLTGVSVMRVIEIGLKCRF